MERANRRRAGKGKGILPDDKRPACTIKPARFGRVRKRFVFVFDEKIAGQQKDLFVDPEQKLQWLCFKCLRRKLRQSAFDRLVSDTAAQPINAILEYGAGLADCGFVSAVDIVAAYRKAHHSQGIVGKDGYF